MLTNVLIVSKETVVLRQWESEKMKQEIFFIKHVDKSRITTVNDLES